MKFSIKDFFSKYDQIHSFLRIWSYLLEKSLMENLVFCAVSNKGITKDTLMQIWKSPNMFMFIEKYSHKNFPFLILRIFELFTQKVSIFLKK